MKKQFLLVLFVAITSLLFAQQKLKKQFTIKIPGEGGSNSCSVVWHPMYKKYFTAMVGNAIYPVASFDANGKNVKEIGQAGQDLRGMWYNESKKRIEYNCFDSSGYGYFVQDKLGAILSNETIMEGMFQPTSQSVGTYKKDKNTVIFLTSDGTLQLYSAANADNILQNVTLYFGCKTAQEKNELDDDIIADRASARNISQVA
jgi:hypothetical protein